MTFGEHIILMSSFAFFAGDCKESVNIDSPWYLSIFLVKSLEERSKYETLVFLKGLTAMSFPGL
jgi:hypothetical protein